MVPGMTHSKLESMVMSKNFRVFGGVVAAMLALTAVGSYAASVKVSGKAARFTQLAQEQKSINLPILHGLPEPEPMLPKSGSPRARVSGRAMLSVR
jgi:hypothetical protein